MSDENLTQVHIDLPQHWAIGGESLWAEDLGGDLYRIRNVPFFAYGLNFHDIVRATADSPDLKPEIREVITPSGHRTLRIIFPSQTQRPRQIELLEMLPKYNASYERADETNVAVDIEADGDYGAVYDQLEAWENEGLLSFETCEARVEGSFDSLIEEEDE